MYRYLAVDAAMRYGTCIKLDGSVAYTAYALAAVAVSEHGIIDVYEEYGTTAMDRDAFVEYAKAVEEAMFEKHAASAETCVVDGPTTPPCRRVVNVKKSGAPQGVTTPWGFINGAEADELQTVVALNNLAHRYANEVAQLLWRRLQQELACIPPYGSHPALEYSLFV